MCVSMSCAPAGIVSVLNYNIGDVHEVLARVARSDRGSRDTRYIGTCGVPSFDGTRA